MKTAGIIKLQFKGVKISILSIAVFLIFWHDFADKFPLVVDMGNTAIPVYEIVFKDEASGTDGLEDADYGPLLSCMRWKNNPTVRSTGSILIVYERT